MTPRITFMHEMQVLDQEVEGMAKMTEEVIEKAVKLIVDMDVSLRTDVQQLDKRIYNLNDQIEKHCLDIIALHTPVASDLRVISACLKIIEDLNRCGRYASDISEVIDVFNGQPNFKRFVSFANMACLVVGMVTDVIDAFITRDAEKASHLHERDDEVDALYDAIFREILTYMMEDPKKITQGINLILVARYLERIADHACNISEYVFFMVNGERLYPTARTGLDYQNKKVCERLFDHPCPRHELDEK